MNFPRRIDHAIRPAAAAAQERQEESPDESINPGGQTESITQAGSIAQAGSSARDLQSDLPVSQEHTEAPRNTPGAHQERTEATRSDQERQERSPDGSITCLPESITRLNPSPVPRIGIITRVLQSDLPVSQEHTEAPRNTPGAHRSNEERPGAPGGITGWIHNRFHQPWHPSLIHHPSWIQRPSRIQRPSGITG